MHTLEEVTQLICTRQLLWLSAPGKIRAPVNNMILPRFPKPRADFGPEERRSAAQTSISTESACASLAVPPSDP